MLLKGAVTLGHLNTTPEGFENRDLTLKTAASNVFLPNKARGI